MAHNSGSKLLQEALEQFSDLCENCPYWTLCSSRRLACKRFQKFTESNVVDRFKSRIPDKHTYDMIFIQVEEEA